MARPARALWSAHDLLQPLRAMAKGGRVGPADGRHHRRARRRHPDDRQHFRSRPPAVRDGKKGCKSLSRAIARRAHDQDPRRRRCAGAPNPARPDRRAYRDLNSSIQVFVWAVWYRGQKKLYEVLRLFYFGGGSQIPPTLTLMWRWTKTTMRSNMSPVLERSGECPACRSASIYSRAISPPAFR